MEKGVFIVGQPGIQTNSIMQKMRLTTAQVSLPPKMAEIPIEIQMTTHPVDVLQ